MPDGNRAGTFNFRHTASPQWLAGTMDYSTTYYWRIDEVNPWATTTGTVWNFTTVGPQ